MCPSLAAKWIGVHPLLNSCRNNGYWLIQWTFHLILLGPWNQFDWSFYPMNITYKSLNVLPEFNFLSKSVLFVPEVSSCLWISSGFTQNNCNLTKMLKKGHYVQRKFLIVIWKHCFCHVSSSVHSAVLQADSMNSWAATAPAVTKTVFPENNLAVWTVK